MEAEKQTITFVVNPASGTGSKTEALEWIGTRLDTHRFTPQVRLTERPGHAMQIAQEAAAQRHWAVVAVGGDGTVNEVARALVHTPTALGIIPTGSGNGLARTLGIPVDAPQAVDLINHARVRLLDYGRINDHLFFCTAGVGFDAVVSMKFAQAGRRGLLTYLETAARQAVDYLSEDYLLEVDGHTPQRQRAFLIACANASQWGNNAYIAPHAALDDGLLDVTIVEPFLMIEAPALGLQLFTKTIDQNLRIKTFRCRRLKISRLTPGVVHFDGDPTQMGTTVDVSIVEKGLSVLAPPTNDN